MISADNGLQLYFILVMFKKYVLTLDFWDDNYIFIKLMIFFLHIYLHIHLPYYVLQE